MPVFNPSENTNGNREYGTHYSSVELETVDHYNSAIDNNIRLISNCTNEEFRKRPFIRSSNGTGSFTYEVDVVVKVAGEHRIILYGVTTIANSSKAISERNPKRYGNANSTITLPNKTTITEKWISESGVAETPQFRDLGIHQLKKGKNIFKVTTTAKGLTGTIIAHKIRRYEGNSNGRGNLFYDKIDFTDNNIEDTNSGTLNTFQIKQDVEFGGYVDNNSPSYLVFDFKDRINIFGGSTLHDNKQLFGGYVSQPADRDDIKDINKIGFMDRWEDATNVTSHKSIRIDGEPEDDSEDTVQCSDIYNAIQYLLDCLEYPINYSNFNQYKASLQQAKNYYTYNTASSKNNKDNTSSSSSAKIADKAKSTLEKTLEEINIWYEKEKKKIDVTYDKQKDTVSLLYASDRAKAQKALPKGVTKSEFKKIEDKLSKLEGKKGLGATEKEYLSYAKKYGTCKLDNIIERKTFTKFEKKYCSYNSYFDTYKKVADYREAKTRVVEEKIKNNKTLNNIEKDRQEATDKIDLQKDKKIATAQAKYASTYESINKKFEWMRLTTKKWEGKRTNWTELQNDPLKGAAKYEKFAKSLQQYAIIWEKGFDSQRTADVTITKDHGIITLEYGFDQNWNSKYKKDKKYDKPFQGYLKIDYTYIESGKIKTGIGYVNFTSEYSDEKEKTVEHEGLIPEEWYDAVYTNVGKEYIFELDLYSYLLYEHLGVDKSFTLKRITFENITDPPEPNDEGLTQLAEDYDIEKEPNSRKILIKNITVRGGKVQIDELIDCRGEYVLTTLRKLVEKANLTMYIKPAKERREDLLVVEEKGAVTEPIKYTEGIDIVDGLHSADYSPKGKIKNSIVKTYKNADTNKEVERHAVDLKSIYHYGTMEDYEDTKYTASSNGYIDYLAKEDLDSTPPNYTQTLSVKGCDDLRVDHLIEIVGNRKHTSGYRTVKSIKRKFSGEESPQWFTDLGIEEKTLATRVEATRAKYK